MTGPNAEDGYGDVCPHPAGTWCDCPWDTGAEDLERGIERQPRYALHHAPPRTMPPVDDDYEGVGDDWD
jgi:hypothetical protein